MSFRFCLSRFYTDSPRFKVRSSFADDYWVPEEPWATAIACRYAHCTAMVLRDNPGTLSETLQVDSWHCTCRSPCHVVRSLFIWPGIAWALNHPSHLLNSNNWSLKQSCARQSKPSQTKIVLWTPVSLAISFREIQGVIILNSGFRGFENNRTGPRR